MEYVGGGSVSSLLRNPDCGPVRGEVREDKVTHGHPQATYTSHDQTTCHMTKQSCHMTKLSIVDAVPLLQAAAGGSQLSSLTGHRAQ